MTEKKFHSLTLWILIVLACSVSSALFAQTLTVAVDRYAISENGSLTLQIQTQSQGDDSLDLSALTQDWRVIDQGTQSSFSNIYGQITSSSLRTLILFPKKSGTLIIPSFRLDDSLSEAIQIEVTPAAETELSDASPMKVTIAFDKGEAKLGEQVLMTVRLEALTTISGISIEEPRIEGGEWTQIAGEQRSELKQGTPINVVEWVYAIIPKEVGEVAVDSRLFSAFQERRGRVVVRSGEASFKISPPEINADHPIWFNANNVEIYSAWGSDPELLRAGEPITRLITVRADGQRANAIPELEIPEGPFKAYPDQPEFSEQTNDTGFIGLRNEAVALVASQEGLLELPEIRLPWWDNNSQQWREAVLPAASIMVLPAANVTTPVAPVDNTGLDGSFDFEGNSGADSTNQSLWSQITSHQAWFWCSILLALALCWALGRPRKEIVMENSEPTQSRSNPASSSSSSLQQLTTAIRSQKTAQVRQELVAWARGHWNDPTISSLDEVAEQSGSEVLGSELKKLDALLYGGASEALDWDLLEQEVVAISNRSARKREKPNPLPPLYPQT